MRSHSAAGFVGPIVQEAAALLLVLVFLLVLRFTSRRRFTAIWLGVFVTHFLWNLQTATQAAAILANVGFPSGRVLVWLGYLAGATQYASLSLTVFGSLDAVGRAPSGKRITWIALIAAAAGLVNAVAGFPAVVQQVQLIVTPILLFGVLQFIIREARGDRARGLLFLGVAMTVRATVSSAYLLAGYLYTEGGVLATTAKIVWKYSGYADAVAVVLLGAAVIVLIVQDSFLEAVRARDAQLRAVAAAERAASLSRVVSEVVRSVGHPIRVVLEKTSALLGTSASGESELREIRLHAERASLLIDDLATYVRTLGRPENFIDLADVARTAAAGIASAVLQRDTVFVVDVPTTIPPVRADRAAVEQIVRGLLDNALDASGQHGRVHLSCRLHKEEVELTVEDSGPGVRDELLPSLFDRGFSTKGGGKGSGLSLSLYAQMARSASGRLRCDNRPANGVGARFVLTLPLAEVHD